MTYRYYISDCLNLINQKKYLTTRYADLVNGKNNHQINKSGDEIVQEVIEKAGLVVK